MPDPTYPITGIRVGWGDSIDREWGPKQSVPVRVEADDFFLNDEYAMQRDLLYHAMVEFKQISYADKLSYFQVAGIHGLPHVPWDAPGSYAPQYCEHSTAKFGSWHRPYMLLFEQRLWEIMVNKVIPEYPAEHQAAMKDAADRFRMPYWDWALRKPRTQNGESVTVYDLPLIVKAQTVEVSDPKSVEKSGTQTIQNPFYKFQAVEEMGEFGVTACQINDEGSPYQAISFDRTITTSRLPPPDNDAQGNPLPPPPEFYTAEGIAGLEGSEKQIQEAAWYYWDNDAPPGTNFKLAEATYRLLSSSYFNSFPEFVTALRDESRPEPDGKYYFSLETVHNNVHNWTGQGYGHMANLAVAGFDPIFWLHHANVDRVMAIWQEINPDKWLDEQGDMGKESLSPFHTDTKGTFFTANSCRDFFSLGYTYPELQPWNFSSKEAYEASIKASNSRKYGPPAETLLTLSNKDVVVNVSFEKFALSGVAFTVKVFLGDKFVGEVHNFSAYTRGAKAGSEAGCQNCQKQQAANTVVTGQIFMSEELADAVRDLPGIKALTEEEIKAYVKANLKAKVYTPNRKEVHIPSLKVVPFIGRREIFKVPVPKSIDGVAKFAAPSELFVDGHVHALSGEEALPGGIADLPEIDVKDLPFIKASWDKEGAVVLVYGTEDRKSTEPIAAVRAGGWGAYEAF